MRVVDPHWEYGPQHWLKPWDTVCPTDRGSTVELLRGPYSLCYEVVPQDRDGAGVEHGLKIRTELTKLGRHH